MVPGGLVRISEVIRSRSPPGGGRSRRPRRPARRTTRLLALDLAFGRGPGGRPDVGILLGGSTGLGGWLRSLAGLRHGLSAALCDVEKLLFPLVDLFFG